MAEPRTPPISFAAAFGLGANQALSLWPAALASFLCGAAEVLAGLVATLGILEWLLVSATLGQAALGGALVVWLAARILRALVEGGAVRQGAERLMGRGFLPLAAEAARAAPRSLSFLLWSFPIELMFTLWSNLALFAGLIAFSSSMASRQGGVLSSAALALALTLLAPVAVFAALWGRVAFVRAVHRDQGVLLSLFQAAGELWAAPWPRVLVLFATGAIVVAGQLVLGGMVNTLIAPAGTEMPNLSLTLAGQMVAGVLVAFVTALAELTRLQSLLAIELNDEGTLPVRLPRQPPPRIATAELIIEAQPVGPPSP